MRFGVMFFGYLWLFVCRGFELYPDILPDIIPNVVGYTLMLFSLIKMERFNRYLKSARKVVQIIIIFVLFNDVYRIYNFSSAEADSTNNTVLIVFKIIITLIFVLYHYYLFKGIGILAADVNIPSITKSCKRDFIILIISSVLTVLSQFNVFGDYNQYLGMIAVLINFIWLIMTSFMVYRCYMWICLEGEEDMSRKEKKLNLKWLNNDKE